MSSNLKLGLEYFHHQYKHKLIADLHDVIEKVLTYLKSGLPIPQSVNEQFETTVMKHLGMKTRVFLDKPIGPSIVYNDFGSNGAVGAKSREFEYRMPELLGGTREATVDLKNVRLGGFYSEVEAYLFLPIEKLCTEGEYTPEELVAFALHELGHQFFSLVTLGEFVRLNYFLQDGVDVLLGKKPNEFKIDILDNRILKGKIKDSKLLERINEAPTAQNYRLAILEVSNERMREHLHSFADLGGIKRSEQVADMFVSRFGYGRHIVTGLYKLTKTLNGRELRGTAMNAFLQLLRVTGVAGSLALPVLAPGLVTVLLAYMVVLSVIGSSKTEGGIYDNLYDRSLKVRNDIIAEMKHAATPDSRKKSALLDLKVVDETIALLKNHPDYFEILGYALNPSYRRKVNILEMERTLEKLMNNDLYALANRART